MRVGIGYDARPFVEGRSLLLGGVEIAGLPGLAGEPSGDAVVAAVLDAILGAAGLAGPAPGPHAGADADDPDAGDGKDGGNGGKGEDGGAGGGGRSGAGVPPLAWLAEGVRRLERENYQVVNVDLTVRGSAVIGERRSAVAESLAGALHARPASVSVKVREGGAWGPAGGADGAAGGPPGRDGGGAGIEVLAVVLIDQIGDIDALHATLRSGG